MGALKADFDVSGDSKQLRLYGSGYDFSVPYEEIGMIYPDPENAGKSVIVTFTDIVQAEVGRKFLQARLEIPFSDMEASIDGDLYFAIYARQLEPGRGEPVHPYLIMKTAIDSYKMENEKISVIGIRDACRGSCILGNVTQVSAACKNFLDEEFRQEPENEAWYLPVCEFGGLECL